MIFIPKVPKTRFPAKSLPWTRRKQTMAQHIASTNKALHLVLISPQTFLVVFVGVHDWIPLGRLNDVAAVRSQDTLLRFAVVTLVQSVPWIIGPCSSVPGTSVSPFRPGLICGCGLLMLCSSPAQLRAWVGTVSSEGRTKAGEGRTKAGRALSQDVRQYALVLAGAEWDCPEHSTHPASCIDCRHVAGPLHEGIRVMIPVSQSQRACGHTAPLPPLPAGWHNGRFRAGPNLEWRGRRAALRAAKEREHAWARQPRKTRRA